jgi:hypothetical protein
MKKLGKLAWLAVFSLSLAGWNTNILRADDGHGKPPKPGDSTGNPKGGGDSGDHGGKPADPGQPGDDHGSGNDNKTDNNPNKPGIGRGRAVEIPRFNIPPPLLDKLPDDVKKLLDEYKAIVDKFVADQKALIDGLRGATSDAKEKVKEQLKANRQTFLDQTKDLRVDIHERIKELRDELKNLKPAEAGGVEGGRRRP